MAEKKHPRGKGYRDALNEWMARSARVLEEYEAQRPK
jgi:hypothetical protein